MVKPSGRSNTCPEGISSRETGAVFFRFIEPCYAKIAAVSQERKPLDATAYGAMVLLCALWGFQQAAIKLIADDVSLLMQAAIRSGAATLLGALLTGGTLTYAIFLRNSLVQSPYRFESGELDNVIIGGWAGFAVVAFPLAVTWINDTFAYFGGRRFGKHKLIPRVSPGKTREGTIAGLIGSVLTAYLYGHFVFELWLGLPFGIVAGVVGGGVVAAAGGGGESSA